MPSAGPFRRLPLASLATVTLVVAVQLIAIVAGAQTVSLGENHSRPLSTAFGSAERATFFDGTSYWVFYHLDNLISPDQIVYRSSSDGRTWSTSAVALSGVWNGTNLGFSVAVGGAKVWLIWAYVDGIDYCRYNLVGTVTGATIAWGVSDGDCFPSPRRFPATFPASATQSAQSMIEATSWTCSCGTVGRHRAIIGWQRTDLSWLWCATCTETATDNVSGTSITKLSTGVLVVLRVR